MIRFSDAPGSSAEILATRWDFPRDIAPNAQATVGLYLNLTPSHNRLLPTAYRVPPNVPEDFRTARLP